MISSRCFFKHTRLHVAGTVFHIAKDNIAFGQFLPIHCNFLEILPPIPMNDIRSACPIRFVCSLFVTSSRIDTDGTYVNEVEATHILLSTLPKYFVCELEETQITRVTNVDETRLCLFPKH